MHCAFVQQWPYPLNINGNALYACEFTTSLPLFVTWDRCTLLPSSLLLHQSQLPVLLFPPSFFTFTSAYSAYHQCCRSFFSTCTSPLSALFLPSSSFYYVPSLLLYFHLICLSFGFGAVNSFAIKLEASQFPLTHWQVWEGFSPKLQ